jgi:hypothetical protein
MKRISETLCKRTTFLVAVRLKHELIIGADGRAQPICQKSIFQKKIDICVLHGLEAE